MHPCVYEVFLMLFGSSLSNYQNVILIVSDKCERYNTRAIYYRNPR